MMLQIADNIRALVLTVVVVTLLWVLFFAPDRMMVGHLEHLTRSDCLLNRPWLVFTYALADGMTWVAYWSIPFTFLRLAYAPSARWHADYSITTWVLSWLAAFVFLCGLNHLFDLLLLRYSLYEEFAYVKVALALVSVYTALYVVRQVQGVVMVPRNLLRQKAEELRVLLNQPARSMQEYRNILQQGLRILDSVSEVAQGEK